MGGGWVGGGHEHLRCRVELEGRQRPHRGEGVRAALGRRVERVAPAVGGGAHPRARREGGARLRAPLRCAVLGAAPATTTLGSGAACPAALLATSAVRLRQRALRHGTRRVGGAGGCRAVAVPLPLGGAHWQHKQTWLRERLMPRPRQRGAGRENHLQQANGDWAGEARRGGMRRGDSEGTTRGSEVVAEMYICVRVRGWVFEGGGAPARARARRAAARGAQRSSRCAPPCAPAAVRTGRGWWWWERVRVGVEVRFEGRGRGVGRGW